MGYVIQVEDKVCSWCKETKRIDDFYSSVKTKASGEEYVYSHPECKECTKKRAKEWSNKNKEASNESKRKHRNSEKGRLVVREWSAKRRASGDYRNWQRNNTEKLKRYAMNRNTSKSHDISKEELELLYDYADNSCMYCGITEEESTIKYSQKLHRDHALNNGSDGIENCILACKGCNSSKHDKDWDIWFNGSSIYDEGRYNAIIGWLEVWSDNPIIQ